jgi:pyruvate dehydrogenase E2 component (dihydrolipoamide acetyltransferase)
MADIQPITMPKWGLAMEEGVLARWAVEEGQEIAAGQEIMDIETTKIANVFESPVSGVLRKKVVPDGETVPVGALLGVVAEPGVDEAELNAFVEKFRESFAQAEKSAASGPVAQIAEVNGRKIRYLKAGPESGAEGATPVVMIHGFGADMSTWMFNQSDLAADRPVYAIDLPGHGGSSKDVGGGSVEALSAVVLDFMDAVGIGAAHLVGHSLGAAIATNMALVSPDRVTGLTLIAPAGFGPDINGAFIEGFIAESRARKLRPVLEMLVADPGMVSGDMVEDVLKFKRLDGALEGLRGIADANFSGNSQRVSLRDRIGEVRVPVRVIWGEADQILPVVHGDGLPSNVGVSRIAGAGHIAHMEKAADVNALIREAL